MTHIYLWVSTMAFMNILSGLDPVDRMLDPEGAIVLYTSSGKTIHIGARDE